MDLERLVRVEAQFCGGRKKFGTGFRVAPGQVLTAQHVIELRRGEETEKASEIFVHWSPGEGKTHVKKPARRQWTGEVALDPKDTTALDIALLEDDLPTEDLEPFTDFVRVALGESVAWESSGFVTVDPEVVDLSTQYVFGRCEPCRTGAVRIQLVNERDRPRDPEDGKELHWSGLSGAPVFVREGPNKGRLYGFIASGTHIFPDRLTMVGTPTLLQNPELRQLLNLYGPVPPPAGLVEQLRALLLDDADLAAGLAELDPAWPSLDVHGLVETLCTDERLGLRLQELRPLYEVLRPSPERKTRCQQLVLILLAIWAGQEIGNLGPEGVTSPRIQVKTASEMAVEPYMASRAGALPEYKPIEKGQALPRGAFQLDASFLESGLRPESALKDQLDLVEKSLGLELLRQDQKARLKRLPLGLQGAERQALICQNLRQTLWSRKRPYYFMAGNELLNRLGRGLERFLEGLEDALPDLQVVVLDPKEESIFQAREHDDTVYPALVMLELMES